MSKEELYNKGENVIKGGVKKYIYDIVSALIMLAIIATTLHIFDIYHFEDKQDIINFLINWIPYCIASVLLNAVLYEKGSFVGRTTAEFVQINKDYSTKVSSLNGKKLTAISEFCIWYNEKCLRDLRADILRERGITIEQYENTYSIDDKTFPPLKHWKRKQLKQYFDKEEIRAIISAKRVKIKGINPNIVLCSFDIKDATNIGPTERVMQVQNNVYFTLRYVFVTALLSVIIFKDIKDWQWAGALEAAFKLVFVVARTFMSYFKGYRNITINLANHIIRKVDIIDIFETWYHEQENSNISK